MMAQKSDKPEHVKVEENEEVQAPPRRNYLTQPINIPFRQYHPLHQNPEPNHPRARDVFLRQIPRPPLDPNEMTIKFDTTMHSGVTLRVKPEDKVRECLLEVCNRWRKSRVEVKFQYKGQEINEGWATTVAELGWKHCCTIYATCENELPEWQEEEDPYSGVW